MQVGTIEWNTLDLSLIGRPRLLITRTPDPEPPVQATRHIVSLTVTIDLEAMDPSTIQARLEYLQRSMHVPEGILKAISPGGHSLEWTAIPGRDSLAEALTGSTNAVELTFMATEPHSQENLEALNSAAFTPLGSDQTLVLHALRDFRTAITTDRHSPLATFRRLTTTTTNFTARVMQTNPADSPAVRMNHLLTKQREMEALNAAAGMFVIGNQTNLVQVQSITPTIDEQRMALDIAVQCYQTSFPGEDTAECNFTLESKEDEGANETVTTVAGTIEAEEESIAMAKLNNLITRHLTTGRRLSSFRKVASKVDGADTVANSLAAEAWTGSMQFTLEFREVSGDGSRWNLKATSSMNARGGMRYSYSGSVKAGNYVTALTKARQLGGSASHPFKTGSEEVIDTASAPGSETSNFVQVTFSYEYEGPASGFLFAEINSDRNSSLFSDWRTVVSGNITAPTSNDARSFLESLLASYSGTIALESSERETELAMQISATVTRAAMRLDFSRSYPVTRTRAAAKFTDDSNVDYGSMTQTRTISGTLWTNTRPNSETALASLISAFLGDLPIQKLRKGHSVECWGDTGSFVSLPSERWVQLDFSAESTVKITGTPGFDIIEAKFTATRTGSINRTVLHEIPMGRPIAQVGIGYNIATLQISASCKARTEAAARTWVQGLRSLVSSIGTAGVTRHETSPPQESVSPDYAPFPTAGATPTVFTFTGNYSYGFSGTVGANDGIWPVNYLPSFSI